MILEFSRLPFTFVAFVVVCFSFCREKNVFPLPKSILQKKGYPWRFTPVILDSNSAPKHRASPFSLCNLKPKTCSAFLGLVCCKAGVCLPCTTSARFSFFLNCPKKKRPTVFAPSELLVGTIPKRLEGYVTLHHAGEQLFGPTQRNLGIGHFTSHHLSPRFVNTPH